MTLSQDPKADGGVVESQEPRRSNTLTNGVASNASLVLFWRVVFTPVFDTWDHTLLLTVVWDAKHREKCKRLESRTLLDKIVLPITLHGGALC